MAYGGLAKLFLKIVINNRVLPVIMVVNNCKKNVDYVSALRNWLSRMRGLTKLLLKIVINNPVLPIFMVVNNCKEIVDNISALTNWLMCTPQRIRCTRVVRELVWTP